MIRLGLRPLLLRYLRYHGWGTKPKYILHHFRLWYILYISNMLLFLMYNNPDAHSHGFESHLLVHCLQLYAVL